MTGELYTCRWCATTTRTPTASGTCSEACAEAWFDEAHQ